MRAARANIQMVFEGHGGGGVGGFGGGGGRRRRRRWWWRIGAANLSGNLLQSTSNQIHYYNLQIWYQTHPDRSYRSHHHL
ncbi:hypothetical protein Leryth_003474 [Lithospermum erythrorhizon]|nr:hypothetical protein Leryth_003474 [Lithospermum erythrorhizon]